MGFLFKKKDVPNELPDLISDEINNQLKQELEVATGASIKSDNLSRKPESFSKPDNFSRSNSISELSNNIDSSNDSESTVLKKLPTSQEDETGYFKELIKGVMADGSNKKVAGWKNKIMSQDIVANMREYWQKQSPEAILNSIGGETKANLLKQVEKLHTLEKEWQNNYLSLMSCEEKIRDEEKQLKNSLNEFVSLYKRNLNRKRK